MSVKWLPLPTGTWKIREFQAHGATFLVLACPEHEPRVIGRTDNGELFIRKVTFDEEKYVDPAS